MLYIGKIYQKKKRVKAFLALGFGIGQDFGKYSIGPIRKQKRVHIRNKRLDSPPYVRQHSY